MIVDFPGMVSIPDQRAPAMPSPPAQALRTRRWSLIAIACAAVALIVTLMVIQPWPDPNHQSADSVVRSAGIPAGVTPGPHQRAPGE